LRSFRFFGPEGCFQPGQAVEMAEVPRRHEPPAGCLSGRIASACSLQRFILQ
jgi:hypothetical protein